jgi:hypothetical protein
VSFTESSVKIGWSTPLRKLPFRVVQVLMRLDVDSKWRDLAAYFGLFAAHLDMCKEYLCLFTEHLDLLTANLGLFTNFWFAYIKEH